MFFLANGLSTFFLKDTPIFNNFPGSLPRNPPKCIILDSWVFNKFIIADELFAKASQNLVYQWIIIYAGN